MSIIPGSTFQTVGYNLRRWMAQAPLVEQARWQGVDVSRDPSARCYELRNVCFEVDLRGVEDLQHWREEIGPNLPWADDHFAERVGGEPLNPGVEWLNWPWGRSAARFRDADELFNHTYQERLWPKYARMTEGGRIPDEGTGLRRVPDRNPGPIEGIHWEYGDLQDLVELLVRDPSTRQAWIPLFFPEDTGWGDGGRKPCTLGYQFLMRSGRLNMWYPLRSCDFARHWADDCYLAVRLLLWVLDRCRERDPGTWAPVVPGDYSMWMTSLHVFENDRMTLVRGSERRS